MSWYTFYLLTYHKMWRKKRSNTLCICIVVFLTWSNHQLQVDDQKIFYTLMSYSNNCIILKELDCTYMWLSKNLFLHRNQRTWLKSFEDMISYQGYLPTAFCSSVAVVNLSSKSCHCRQSLNGTWCGFSCNSVLNENQRSGQSWVIT